MSAFDDFKKIFESAATEYNALHPSSNEPLSSDTLRDMFINIRDRLKVLSGDYESVLCNREGEIIDTLIQLLNYILDHCVMCKYYDIYKKLAMFASDLFGKDSELQRLLDLLKQYVIQYNNIKIPESAIETGTRTSYGGNTYTYGTASSKYFLSSNIVKSTTTTINDAAKEIDDWITEYNEYIEEYNDKIYSPHNLVTAGNRIADSNGLLYVNNLARTSNPKPKKLLENLPDTVDEMLDQNNKDNSIYTIMETFKNNGIFYGSPEVFETIRKTFGYDIIGKLLACLPLTTYTGNDKIWQEVSVGSYGDGSEMYLDDSSKLHISNIDMSYFVKYGYREDSPLYQLIYKWKDSKNTVNIIYVTRDENGKLIVDNGGDGITPLAIPYRTLNDYMVIGQDREIAGRTFTFSDYVTWTVYYDANTDKYYKYDKIGNGTYLNIDALVNETVDDNGDIEDPELEPIYDRTDQYKLYAHDHRVYYYTYSSGGAQSFNGILNDATIDSSMGNNFMQQVSGTEAEKYLSNLEAKNVMSNIVKNIEDNYPPKQLLRRKIVEISDKIFKYIAQYMGITLDNDGNGNYSISSPDENGEVEVEIKDSKTSKKGARSIFARSFKNNRFAGYIGKVDKKGYVAQKSYVFMSIPVTRSNKRKNKKLSLSCPNLKLVNVEFKNNPKNIIFRLFNKWDYTANIEIENDGEKPNDKNKSPYIMGKYYLRFGSIFPAKKDLDFKATSQQIKISEPNKSSSWSSGRIYKRGIFETSNVRIKGLFQNDDATYDNEEKYRDKFSDKIDIQYEILSTTDSKKYIFKGEGLELNNDLKNDMIKESSYYANSSFYKGSMKLEDPSKPKKDDGTDTSDTSSSKDVIVILTPINNTNYTSPKPYFSVSIYADPDSTMNNQIWEQNENDPSVYIPMLVANIFINKVRCKSVLSKTKTSDKLSHALLGLASMLSEENISPFNYELFDNFMNMIEEYKSDLLNELIEAINNIGSAAQTVILTNGMYKTYDKSYCDQYVSDLVTQYSNIKSKCDTFISQITDVDSIYHSSFNTDMDQTILSLSNQYSEYTKDIILSEDMIHKYKNKLNITMPTAQIQVNLNSTLSLFYNFVTGNSQSLSAMASGGGKVITTYLTRDINSWLSIYNGNVYTADDVTATKYCIEQEYLQLFYLLSVVNESLRNIYNPVTDELNEYYRSLLLRFLSENFYNIHLQELYDSDVIRRMSEYKKYQPIYDISNLSFDTYYINPYITEIFPQLEILDSIEIDELPTMLYKTIENVTVDSLQDWDITNFFKPFIYKAILEESPSKIHDKLIKLWDFLNNGQKLNVRELILKYNLMFVLLDLKEIKNDQYHISDKTITIDSIREILRVIIAVSEYRELINKYSTEMLFTKTPVKSTGTAINQTMYKLLTNKDIVVKDGD